jgi:membrane-associated protease RseP (regulator of RpoE activity)
MPVALAQVEIEEEGRVIRIGPDRAAAPEAPEAPAGVPMPAMPALPPGVEFFSPAAPVPASDYMIGVAAENVRDDLRAHVDLPKYAGLIVRSVLPQSPAEAAGILVRDILIKADGTTLESMENLVDAVDASGKAEKPLVLEVLRKGETLSVSVTPKKRDKTLQAAAPAVPGGPGFANPLQLEFRELGPMLGLRAQGMPLNNMPNGVSISVSKKNDEPAEITVKRGDETWTVKGNDEEALAKLPEDLQPMVKQMLGESGGNVIFDLPTGGLGQFRMRAEAQADAAGAAAAAAAAEAQARIEERLQEMERMMEQMRQQMQENN